MTLKFKCESVLILENRTEVVFVKREFIPDGNASIQVFPNGTLNLILDGQDLTFTPGVNYEIEIETEESESVSKQSINPIRIKRR